MRIPTRKAKVSSVAEPSSQSASQNICMIQDELRHDALGDSFSSHTHIAVEKIADSFAPVVWCV
jgi:hypothetical protein